MTVTVTYDLGHAMYILTAVLRLTQASAISGSVKCISAFELNGVAGCGWLQPMDGLTPQVRLNVCGTEAVFIG